MPKERSPLRDKAFDIWRKSKGEMKLKDIAEQLGVSDAQIRKWKNQDSWDDHLNGSLPKKTNSNVTIPKGNVTNRNSNGNAKEKNAPKAAPPIEYVEPEDDELNDKQRLFCIYYVKCFNSRQAALKAGYSPDTAHVQGARLLSNAKVGEEIKRLKSMVTSALFIDAADIFNAYAAIAFADINNYVEFGQEEVLLFTKKGAPIMTAEGNQATAKQSFVALRNADGVDGSIISEVKEGKDGVSVKLHDKMKALEFLTKYYDLLPDHHKRRLDDEKLKIDKERLEMEKDKAKKDDDSENKTIVVALPDGFNDESNE